jgi:membrane protease YdiL (CAAX protease family)
MDEESGVVRAPHKPSLVYQLAWIFYLLLAVGGALWIGWRGGTIALEQFIDLDRWWLNLAAGVSAAGVLLLAWEGARRLFAAARRLERQLAELLGPLPLPEVLALALLSGFAEELFFRGAMQAAWGWFPATLLFTALHSGPGPSYRVWTAFAGLAGLVLAGLMAWSGNLLAPVVAHALVNAVNLARISRRSVDVVVDTPRAKPD